MVQAWSSCTDTSQFVFGVLRTCGVPVCPLTAGLGLDNLGSLYIYQCIPKQLEYSPVKSDAS